MTIPNNALRDFGVHTKALSEIMPIAFECTLAELAPSLIKDSRGVWSEEANSKFHEETYNKSLHGKVHITSMMMIS